MITESVLPNSQRLFILHATLVCCLVVPLGCVWAPVPFSELHSLSAPSQYTYRGAAPSNENVTSDPTFAQVTLRDKKVLVVTDLSVSRISPDGKSDYISLFDSRRATQKAALSVAAFLVSQGLPKPDIRLMSVGEFLEPDHEHRVCRYPFGEPQSSKPPFWMSDECRSGANPGANGIDAPSVQLVAAVFDAFRAYMTRTNGKLHGGTADGEEALSKAIQQLTHRYACEYVLVVTGCGRIVTADDVDRVVWPQILLTSTLSAVGSLGLFGIGIASYPVPSLVTVAILADAETGKLLWINTHPVIQSDLPNDLVYGSHGVTLFGGHPVNHWHSYETEHLDKSLVGKVTDPALREWSGRRCNVFWLNWAKHVLYYAVRYESPK